MALFTMNEGYGYDLFMKKAEYRYLNLLTEKVKRLFQLMKW